MAGLEPAVAGIYPLAAPRLATLAFAQLAPAEIPAGPEASWLSAQCSDLSASALDLESGFAWWWQSPPERDRPLHRLATVLHLSPPECLALALALAADSELSAARALAWLQLPRRESHPTIGLIACLEEKRRHSLPVTLGALLDGEALASGLFVLDHSAGALPEAALRIPLPLVAALLGGEGRWPNVRLTSMDAVPCGGALRNEATRRAGALEGTLIVRSSSTGEARAVCVAMANATGRPAAMIEGECPSGLGPWLILHDALPVLCADAAPGERRSLPQIAGYHGGMLVATGIDGSWEHDGQAIASWTIPIPSVPERMASWQQQGLDPDSARTLARTYRLGGTGTRQLIREAVSVQHAEGGTRLEARHIVRAARATERGMLGTLAEPLGEDIDDPALVLPEILRQDLQTLFRRCQVRDELAADLGAAARARYRPGVRALFVGASGTGKTLACGWLATRLGLPLYRVDLACVTSKYIGETEKNLGELFARAESCNVVLLFDEADALFGKRTDVKDAHDRYANQQTNYLLQRIESYDGIVLLTSNSRTRFDSAFSRRLDAILEFPLPQPEERRALWLAHLGQAHVIAPAQLNRIAAGCELAGGHIRNIVFAARSLSPDAPITWPMLELAVAAEYRKLGKQLPSALGSGARMA